MVDVECDAVAEGEADGVKDDVTVGDKLPVGESVGEGDGVPVVDVEREVVTEEDWVIVGDNVILGDELPVGDDVELEVGVLVNEDPYEGVTEYEPVIDRELEPVGDAVLVNDTVAVADTVLVPVLLFVRVGERVEVKEVDCVKYSELEKDIVGETEADPVHVAVADMVGVMVTLMDGVSPGVRLEEMAGKGDALGIFVTAAEVMAPIPVWPSVLMPTQENVPVLYRKQEDPQPDAI